MRHRDGCWRGRRRPTALDAVITMLARERLIGAYGERRAEVLG
jgi:hypothetical protein